jgi:hypothetical protein
MKKHLATTLSIGAAALALNAAPAFALSNPLVVNIRVAKTAVSEASATIFGSGKSVLVDITGNRAIPNGSAITLNRGACAHPGAIAFALAASSGDESLTKLRHSLVDVAARARSLVIHRTASELSPVLACGPLTS